MTFSCTIENRQIQFTKTNGTERYAYRPDNRFINRKTTSGTELVLYYGVNEDRSPLQSLSFQCDGLPPSEMHFRDWE